ncbi:ABC transporter permease [Embleya scabrispora]|uniref:ABC transporter permease n=1 Tax=Embleya scabrispora TaxID=159449 RepID=UPI00036D8CE2|nr:ABC transporter permease [Embleya scabrispora]MYS85173.1 ABC transporter permease [Streptomyces sp. SID5474]
MSLVTHTPVPRPPRRAGSPDRARRRDLVGAEWIKFWSLRSTPVTLGVLAVLYPYFAWRAGRGEYRSWPNYTPPMRDAFDAGHTAFPGPTWFLMMVGTGTIGALTVAGEHAGGLIRTTFTAVPARGRVVLAKAAVLTKVMTALGLVVAVGSYQLSQAALGDRVPHHAITEPDALRAVAATTLLLPLCALVGMALAAVIRATAGSVFAVCAVFVLLPAGLRSTGGQEWLDPVVNAQPWYAWGRLTGMGNGHIVGSVPSFTAAWTAMAAWPVAAVAVAVVALRVRDV